jgi:hypothetical protein
MAKDKVFGLIIMFVGIILIVVYIFWAPVSLYYERHPDLHDNAFLSSLYEIPGSHWSYAVVVPLTLIVVAAGLLAAWIGFSMFTTPPPVPLEELEEELEAEEAASKAEEKKE